MPHREPVPPGSVCSSPARSAVFLAGRWAFCGLSALAAGVYTWWFWGKPQAKASDFGQIWAAARHLLAGGDPYQAVGPGRPFEWDFPLLYPLPAVLAAVPLAPLSLRWADALFMAISIGLLVWALTARRLANPQLLGIISIAGIFLMQTCQWSALLTAAALVPSLGWLLICKPTIGLALWCAYPSRRALVGGAVLLAISLVIRPTWPWAWISTMSTAPHIRPLLLQPGGALALMALLRWRRPEARLLAALVCVPHTPVLYEAVPLFLVPQRAVESGILALLTWAVLIAQAFGGPYTSFTTSVAASGFWMVWLLYLPCVLLVLTRPNDAPEGALVPSPSEAECRPVAASAV